MKFIAYDLGTGGVKASLYNEKLETIGKSFMEYGTDYPRDGFHEQRPMDWWQKVIESTKKLIAESNTDPEDIKCLAISGHSCVAVPLDKDGKLLMDKVPIWSDTRAVKETEEFFSRIDNDSWYMTTGNGFPPACYAVFKLMWIKKNMPELFDKIDICLGSKDFINYMLTGEKGTDYSYACSFGVFNLKKKVIEPELVAAAGIPDGMFPKIYPSHHIVGTVSGWAAEQTGLAEGTMVACGGVDNMCMALGAVGSEEGKVYVSLGSSSWVPINSSEPVLDPATRPYVFALGDDNMYTSAYSIFAGGSSFKWVKNTLCRDFADSPDAYNKMSELAASSPIGANGIFFNPSLAGGTTQDKSINIRGNYLGLHLGTTREDMIRAAMEGIAMNLKMSVDNLSKKVKVAPEILFCGGGARSPFWMQMFADVFGKDIIKTNIDQDAASLGAVALCVRAMGIWKDYSMIPKLHKLENRSIPNKEVHEEYGRLLEIFKYLCEISADIGDYMHSKLNRS